MYIEYIVHYQVSIYIIIRIYEYTYYIIHSCVKKISMIIIYYIIISNRIYTHRYYYQYEEEGRVLRVHAGKLHTERYSADHQVLRSVLREVHQRRLGQYCRDEDSGVVAGVQRENARVRVASEERDHKDR